MVFLLFYVREYREGGDGTPSVPKRSTKMQELQYPFDGEYLLKKKKRSGIIQSAFAYGQ